MSPVSANPEGSSEAGDRLFSNPETVPGKFTEDWEAYVEPELRHLFQSAIETVESDLKGAEKITRDQGGSEYKVQVPRPHIEAWVSAINKARLVLAARHRFDSAEIEGELPEFIESPREMALLQLHLYDFLLLNFLQEMEY